MAKPISSRTAILAVLAAMPGLVHSTPAPVGQEAQSAALDSIEQNLDPVEAQARRSLFGGGSKPVSFSGEALLRFIGTSYDEYPGWMEKDKTESKNSLASVRVAMVAAPHRNLRLWSKIAFNHALMGNNSPAWGTPQGYRITPQTGYYDPHSSILYEDMCAGLLAKTGPVTTQTKLGGVLWTEGSPLTLWKGQNRMFGWDYVPYELEQSSAQYWEYATIKGEKTGRAAWNKKPFQGLSFESIEMPWNAYFTLTYGNFEGFQKFQPYFINANNTNGLLYTGQDAGSRSFASKGLGLGESYRKALTFRLAKAELPGAVTAGLNFMSFQVDNDYAKQWEWGSNWGGLSSADANPIRATYKDRSSKDSIKYKANYFLSYKAGSIDVRRNLPGGLQFHVDIALSQVDTAYFKVDDSGAGDYRMYRAGFDSATVWNTPQYSVLGHKKSDITPAIYGMVSYPFSFAQFDLHGIWAPKKFYSGTSFVMPLDAFFPFEANLLGAGKFAGTDGGTPYASNMTGANLITKLPMSGGHFKLTSGFHTQLENGRDLIYFPWRLNGSAFKYSINASTTQYDGAGLIDDYLRGNAPGFGGAGGAVDGRFRQIRRIGDDFYTLSSRRNTYGPTPGEAGGIRSDFMSTFENFGAFKLRKDPAHYSADSLAIARMYEEGVMPQSAKKTQNLSLDVSYDLSRFWQGKRSVFLGGYAALNSVTKNGTPIPAFGDDDNTLLRGMMLRVEPVVQLTQKFYLIGLAGLETWNSSYGVALIDSATKAVPVGGDPAEDADFRNPAFWRSAPINYQDWMVGMGFDWDIAPRVGLHVRAQRFSHKDKGISEELPAVAGNNDFSAWLLHAETKMWF